MGEAIKKLAESLENTKVEQNGAVIVLTMNRPKALNALNDKTLDELERIFSCIEGETDVLGVILTGEGKAFVAGADISQMSGYGAEEGRNYTYRAQSVFNRIEALEKPVIVAVNGYALGGGCELSMCGDIRIASEKAVFGQPEVNIGLIPCFGGTQRLSRLVGTGIAKELIFTARQIRADEAKAIGLVNKVVPPEKLISEAEAMMNDIIGKAPIAVRYAKVSINKGVNMDLMSALELEKDVAALVFASDDSREGTAAFLAKRPPVFQNK